MCCLLSSVAAAAYGNGTYFAVNASYSASNTYSVPDAQGQKYMYLCRVLTGDFTTGRQGMIVPPAKNNTTADLYDTVTDNPNTPSMFVVFNDIQAYPEYLITFKWGRKPTNVYPEISYSMLWWFIFFLLFLLLKVPLRWKTFFFTERKCRFEDVAMGRFYFKIVYNKHSVRFYEGLNQHLHLRSGVPSSR